MDSWGWAILLAAVTAVSAMLLMALYDEISRRKWLAKSGAEPVRLPLLAAQKD